MVHHAIGHFLKGEETYVQPQKINFFLQTKIATIFFPFSVALSPFFIHLSVKPYYWSKFSFQSKKSTSGMLLKLTSEQHESWVETDYISREKP